MQAPTPNSAIMTVSLEGYLEPTRISFGSPPSSELNPRGPSPDESFPVFSPPPYDQPPSDQPVLSIRHRRQSSFIGPPWLNSLQTPRQSIISTTSRSPHSHHTCNLLKQIMDSLLQCPVYTLPRSTLASLRHLRTFHNFFILIFQSPFQFKFCSDFVYIIYVLVILVQSALSFLPVLRCIFSIDVNPL